MTSPDTSKPQARHKVLRCLYNAETKLAVNDIVRLTGVSLTEVQTVIRTLQQSNRAAVDHDGHVWLLSHNPDDERSVSPILRTARIAAADELLDADAPDRDEHRPIEFRDPPSTLELLSGVMFGLQRIEYADQIRWHGGAPIPFRDPPTPPTEAPTAFDEHTLQDWRADIVQLPNDAAELARIQRSVIKNLNTLDTPPVVLRALERIAELLEQPQSHRRRSE